MTQEHLAVRKEIKSKKPNFVRADIHKNKSFTKTWRRPKGWQNKMRLNKNGKRRCVSSGWGSPSDVKGLSREGLEFVNVSNVSDLAGLSKDKHKVIVSSTVGARKKLAIFEEVKKLGLLVENFKDVDKKVESINGTLKENKAKSDAAKKRVEERVKKATKTDDKKATKTADKKEATEEKPKEAPKKKVVVKKADDKKE